jgi:hypothetical protein
MDHRDSCGALRWWKDLDRANRKATTQDGIEVPVSFEVCPTCEGRGSHVNPSIDAHGLSADDFAEDPDFAEDYWSGAYDVPCYLCGGATTTPVCEDAEIRREMEEQIQANYEYMREVEAERRMGA